MRHAGIPFIVPQSDDALVEGDHVLASECLAISRLRRLHLFIRQPQRHRRRRQNPGPLAKPRGAAGIAEMRVRRASQKLSDAVGQLQRVLTRQHGEPVSHHVHPPRTGSILLRHDRAHRAGPQLNVVTRRESHAIEESLPRVAPLVRELLSVSLAHEFAAHAFIENLSRTEPDRFATVVANVLLHWQRLPHRICPPRIKSSKPQPQPCVTRLAPHDLVSSGIQRLARLELAFRHHHATGFPTRPVVTRGIPRRHSCRRRRQRRRRINRRHLNPRRHLEYLGRKLHFLEMHIKHPPPTQIEARNRIPPSLETEKTRCVLGPDVPDRDRLVRCRHIHRQTSLTAARFRQHRERTAC